MEGHGIHIDRAGNRYMTVNRQNPKNPNSEWGYFSDGKIYGECEVQYRNGDEYHGELKNFLKHGYGKMKYTQLGCNIVLINLGQEARAGLYAGFWKHDKREAKGKMKFSDGSWFDGVWKADNKHKGTMYETNSKLQWFHWFHWF